jgi:hypothetical protein
MIVIRRQMCQEVTENSYLGALNLILSFGLNSEFRNTGVSARQCGAERMRTSLYFHVISGLIRIAGVRSADISNQKVPYATNISKKYGISSTVIPTGMAITKNSFLSVSTG